MSPYTPVPPAPGLRQPSNPQKFDRNCNRCCAVCCFFFSQTAETLSLMMKSEKKNMWKLEKLETGVRCSLSLRCAIQRRLFSTLKSPKTFSAIIPIMDCAFLKIRCWLTSASCKRHRVVISRADLVWIHIPKCKYVD